MCEVEEAAGKPRSNRMFFLSIPPNVFIPAAGGAADHCSTRCEGMRAGVRVHGGGGAGDQSQGWDARLLASWTPVSVAA